MRYVLVFLAGVGFWRLAELGWRCARVVLRRFRYWRLGRKARWAGPPPPFHPNCLCTLQMEDNGEGSDCGKGGESE